jgi:FAD/FMN-containing dehydrogenase
MTCGVLVSLDHMQALLEVDRVRLRVRVQAGVRLHRLNALLAEHGLALAIVGSVTEQSIAGVLATGTHGSSLVHGNIASFVVGARLITGTGELLELDEAHPLLPAVRVGLGALGILTEVTLAVVPAFRLCERSESLPLAQAIAELEQIARSAEYVKLWWLPHTEQAIVFRYDRTDAPGEVSPLVRWLDRWLINALVFGLLLQLGRVLPAIIPPINRLVARTYLDARLAVGRSDLRLSVAMPPRHREMEYAVPLARAPEAIASTRALIDRLGLRVNFLVEARFVPADDAWMSPAHGRDTCQLGAYMAEAPGIEDYFREFEQMMLRLGGRPHWGKEFSVGAADIHTMYPRAEQFVATVRELDPDAVLANEFVARVLTPTPE